MNEENQSCFVRPQPSEYTGSLQVFAKNNLALAFGLAGMGTKSWNTISGESLPAVDEVFPKTPDWQQGFKTATTRMMLVFLGKVVAEDVPTYIWPVFPKADHELCELLHFFIRTPENLPQTLALELRQRVATKKKTARKDQDRRRRSKLWALSQGNTAFNTLKDWRYRPSFGGIRL